MADPRVRGESGALLEQVRFLKRELKIKTKEVDQFVELVDQIRGEWKKSDDRWKAAEDKWRVERLYRKRLEHENTKLRQKAAEAKMQSPNNRSRKRSLETTVDGGSEFLDDSNITKRRLVEDLSTVKEDTDEGESELENVPPNSVIPETPHPPDFDGLDPQSMLDVSFDLFSTALASNETSTHDLSTQFQSSCPKLRRSTSVPNMLESSSKEVGSSRNGLNRAGSMNDGNSNARNLLSGNRKHEIVAKRNFLTLECAVCRKGIKFGVLACKCKTCKLSFHECCKTKMEVIACLPQRETPRKGATRGRARLGDFCPDARPMIPHLIGHCIIQLEKAAATSEVYLGSGDEESVDRLLNTFRMAKTFPGLADCPPAVLAGCVKKFLNEIRDPLIPLTYRKEFCEAGDSEEAGKLLECINNLPTCHANTLVALCVHWQEICECNENEDTTADALAEVLGPVIFGTKRLGVSTQPDVEEKLTESFRKILKMPTDHFRELLNTEHVHGTPVSRTPSNRSTSTMKSGAKTTPISRI